MFSTPQSKAFFSQQIIKGKLIAQQIQLVSYISDRTWQAKAAITQLIKILQQPNEDMELVSQKIKKIEQLIQCSHQMIMESNQQFQFQVSLRADIKNLEHAFFKNVMMGYQDKIKELKHCLLLLENDVQQLQQNGLLPYVENPKKNNILSSKIKNFVQYKQNLDTINGIQTFVPIKRLQNIIVSLVDVQLHKKQPIQTDKNMKTLQTSKSKSILQTQKIPADQIDKSFQIKEVQNRAFEELVQPEKNLQLTSNSFKQKKLQHTGINQMLKILKNWGDIVNFKLKKNKRIVKEKIESLSHKNKVLKQGIRNYKKIMKYEQYQSNVRYGQIELTRQQAIDFLNEMNQDLQRRFTRRNIYMVISLFPDNKRTKSSTDLKYLGFGEKDEHGQDCLREVDTNLNNSFLDQYSQLTKIKIKK